METGEDVIERSKQRGAESLDLADVVSSIVDGVVVLDSNGICVLANPAMLEMTGFTVEDMVGTGPPFPHWPPEHTERLKSAVAGCLRGDSQDFLAVLLRENGTRFRALVSPSPLRDEKGDVRYLVATIKDVTERERADEALRQSEKRYRRVVEDQSEFVVRWRPDGTRIFVNDAYCRYFQQSREQLIGESFLPLIAKEDRERVRERIRSASRENPISYDEHRVNLPRGGIGWQRWSDRAIFTDDGRLIEFQSVGMDITDRKRSEEALAQRLRFQSLVGDVSTRLLSTAPAGIGDVIEESLERVAGLYGLDRVSIRWLDENRQMGRLVRAWQRPGTAPLPSVRDWTDLPWFGIRVARGETIRISGLEDVPEEMSREREFLAALNTKSLLAIPLGTGDQSRGVFYFATEREPVEWSDPIVEELQTFGGLLASAIVRARAEEALAERLIGQSLAAELSATLLSCPATDLDRQIEASLERMGETFDFDRVAVRSFDPGRTQARVTHKWQREGSTPSPVAHDLGDLPWVGPRVFSGEIVRIETLQDFPRDASRDREWYSSQNLKSALIVPLTADTENVGACIFSTERFERSWPDPLVNDLRSVAKMIGSSMVRARAERGLQDALSEVARLKERLQAENVYLREEIRSTTGFDEIVGESQGLKDCLDQVTQVAKTKSNVMILGETGTGKELIARALHDLSDRGKRPLVKVNCAALPSTLIESELFGHEKGAFTGADRRREGRFELADGGTLFLDEVGDLPLELQGKLLRVLQEGEFERIGGTQTLRVDVRLIAATHRDLERAVELEEFRADLFYRLNVFPITLPPLRERKEDIPLLAVHFARKHARRMGRKVDSISPRFLDHLVSRPWHGNLRELENVIERALISSHGPVLDPATTPGATIVPESPRPRFPSAAQAGTAAGPSSLLEVERQHIVNVLRETGWVIEGRSGAATRLGMPPSSLRSKMKRLGIERELKPSYVRAKRRDDPDLSH